MLIPASQTPQQMFDKSILMETVKPFFELQCTKHVNTCALKFEIEASHVLKKYLRECIYVYIYTLYLNLSLFFLNFKSSP